MITDAQFQRWLERSGSVHCALIRLTFVGDNLGGPNEFYAYVANRPYVTRPTDVPPNQEFDECVIDVPSFTRRMGEQLEGRTSQSYGDLILANPYELDGQGQVVVAGAKDDWLQMNWNGREYSVWLGDPAWPFSDFRLIQKGTILDVFDPGNYKLGFKLGGKEALLQRDMITALLGGDGPQAGDLMPMTYGAQMLNITPKLIDKTDHIYRYTNVDLGGLIEVPNEFVDENPTDVREDGESLADYRTLDSVTIGTNLLEITNHGFDPGTRFRFPIAPGVTLPAPYLFNTDYWVSTDGLTLNKFKGALTPASALSGGFIVITGGMSGMVQVFHANWTVDPQSGTFQLAASPVGLITCDVYGLMLKAPSPDERPVTAGAIARQVLTSGITNTPLSLADFDTANLAAFIALCPTFLSCYLTNQITFEAFLDKLVLSIGGWWSMSRAGLLQFGRLDLPVAGTPVYSFTNDDVAQRSMKILRRILPRAQIKCQGVSNWTKQSAIVGDVEEYLRSAYMADHRVATGVPVAGSWEDNPSNHKNAVYPPIFETLISDELELQFEADRLAEMFKLPTAVFGFQTPHQVAYLLNLGDLIYLETARFTGYGIVVGLTERIKGRSDVEFFARLPNIYPTADL